MTDLRSMLAVASDPQAQHWLGWPDQIVQQARQWTGLLGVEPGQAAGYCAPWSRAMSLAAAEADQTAA